MFKPVDLRALAAQEGVELDPALVQLKQLYEDIDGRVAKTTRKLDLPCSKGCDACCYESVFITPLEFFAVWDFVQSTFSAADLDEVINDGLHIYERNRDLIAALEAPPPDGKKDHFAIAQQLKFRCPLLGASGACRVYPVRELYARLFGCSFNEEGGIYGCHLVGAHLAGKTVTLLPVRGQALRLNELPLTHKRQVYPYYIHWLYPP